MSFKNLFGWIAITCYYLIVTVQGAGFTGPTNIKGIQLIKVFEKFSPSFQTNVEGTKTIGFGYRCENTACNSIRAPISESKADSLLQEQLKTSERCINRNVTYKLNKDQFIALVSFINSVGCSVFENSDLLTKLNDNDVKGAADEFATHNTLGGKVVTRLTTRRKGERQIFCSNKSC